MGAFKEIDVEIVLADQHAIKNIEMPMLGEIQCGFPSPAADYIEANLNLHEFLIKKPAATFFMKAKGDSMIGAGVYPDDLLIVDRSITARSSHLVVASVHGEFTLKRLAKIGNKILLMPENSKYKNLEITDESELQIFGVVTFNIHKHL